MFTARYGLIPYIKQIAFRLLKVNVRVIWLSDPNYMKSYKLYFKMTKREVRKSGGKCG